MAFWDHAGKAGIVASVFGGLVALVGAIYYFVHLEARMDVFDDRVSKVEARMGKIQEQQDLIKGAPQVIVQPDHQSSSSPPQPIPNPLIVTCMQLIRDETVAANKTDIHSESTISARISSLDCTNVLKAQAPAK
jgi:hypothetical protein